MASLINRSRRQWVVGDFIIPAGVPTARIVDIPERLHARGPHSETHERDDAKNEKFKKILDSLVNDPNSEVQLINGSATTAVDPVIEQARADEIAALKDQNAKLQRLVASGDGAEALAEFQAKLDKAQEDAKALFDQVTTATNRNAELEAQLKAALAPKKK